MPKRKHSDTELEKCCIGSEMKGSQQPLLLLPYFIWFLNKRLEVVHARNRVHTTKP